MLKGYYFITDGRLSRSGNLNDVKAAVRAGAAAVQFRSDEPDALKLYAEAMRLKALCRNTIFIVNDRVDIAVGVNADGVHLGRGDMPFQLARKLLGKNKIIGVTVHNIKEAAEAKKLGADYIGVSPIFATGTKSDAGKPCGTALIKKIRQRVSIPIVAIGGIDLSNASEVIAAGADCVCAISAVVTKRDVEKEILRFQAMFPNL